MQLPSFLRRLTIYRRNCKPSRGMAYDKARHAVLAQFTRFDILAFLLVFSEIALVIYTFIHW